MNNWRFIQIWLHTATNQEVINSTVWYPICTGKTVGEVHWEVPPNIHEISFHDELSYGINKWSISVEITVYVTGDNNFVVGVTGNDVINILKTFCKLCLIKVIILGITWEIWINEN